MQYSRCSGKFAGGEKEELLMLQHARNMSNQHSGTHLKNCKRLNPFIVGGDVAAVFFCGAIVFLSVYM